MQARRSWPRLLRTSATLLLTFALMLLVACGSAGGEGERAAPLTSPVGVAAPSADPETLYQVSTLSALIDGLYQPATTVGALRTRGDTGIGTFAALDGEMVAVDGVVHQVLADGSVTRPTDDVGSPFACFTTFAPDVEVRLQDIADYQALQRQLDDELDGVNHLYALRIEGHFAKVRTRSVPAQSEPYPPLLEITDQQPEFTFSDVDGVLVGFWCPEWVGQINAVGYHLHFLTADRSGGGHLLEVSIDDATAGLDETPVFDLTLPDTEEFRDINLSGDYEAQMREAEE